MKTPKVVLQMELYYMRAFVKKYVSIDEIVSLNVFVSQSHETSYLKGLKRSIL